MYFYLKGCTATKTELYNLKPFKESYNLIKQGRLLSLSRNEKDIDLLILKKCKFFTILLYYRSLK